MNKNGGDVAAGILQCLSERKKKPEIVNTAGQTSFDSYALRDYFKEKKIKHYTTRSHSAFGERFIKTYKALRYKRIGSINNKALEDPMARL